jgi:hypothetical protein
MWCVCVCGGGGRVDSVHLTASLLIHGLIYALRRFINRRVRGWIRLSVRIRVHKNEGCGAELNSGLSNARYSYFKFFRVRISDSSGLIIVKN